MSEPIIENAIIESTKLTIAKPCFCAWLYLKYDGGGQGFGGFCLDEYDKTKGKRIGGAYGAEFIKRILETLGVTEWEKLPGTPCRSKHTSGEVEAIGQFIEDKWFSPIELAKEMGLKDKEDAK